MSINPDKTIKCKACNSELEAAFENKKSVRGYVQLLPLVLFSSGVALFFNIPEPFNNIIYSLSAVYSVIVIGYFYKTVTLKVLKYGI